VGEQHAVDDELLEGRCTAERLPPTLAGHHASRGDLASNPLAISLLPQYVAMGDLEYPGREFRLTMKGAGEAPDVDEDLLQCIVAGAGICSKRPPHIAPQPRIVALVQEPQRLVVSCGDSCK